MTSESLSLMQEGRVRRLTLNRPDTLNALDADLRQRVARALREASDDPEVGAIVLTGTGGRAFCAGQDLNESADIDPDHGGAWMATWKSYFQALCACEKPIVVALNGLAAGAGLQTALLGDLRIGVEGARLIMAEVDVGLPAITGSFLLTRHLGLSRSTELVLSGRAMAAAEAREIGLLTGIVAPDALAERAQDLAAELAAKPPCAMRLTLSNLRRALAAGMAEAEDAAVAYQSEAVATGEPQKVMAAFLARRRERQSAEKNTLTRG